MVCFYFAQMVSGIDAASLEYLYHFFLIVYLDHLLFFRNLNVDKVSIGLKKKSRKDIA